MLMAFLLSLSCSWWCVCGAGAGGAGPGLFLGVRVRGLAGDLVRRGPVGSGEEVDACVGVEERVGGGPVVEDPDDIVYLPSAVGGGLATRSAGW